MKLYKVKNWSEIYENNRTRELKEMKWLPLPIKLNGDGYTFIMLQKNGAAIFGAFVTVLEVAAICDPRGTLIRNTNRPHDANSLSRLTRISETIISEMLNTCSTIDCNWLVCEDFMEGATFPHEGATFPQGSAEPVMLCNTIFSNVVLHKAEEVYSFYPRKVGKGAAIKKISLALKKISHEELIEKVKNYAESVKDKDPQYIPHPATWFNQERYLDPIEQKLDNGGTHVFG